MSFDYKVLGKKIKEAREGFLIKPQEIANLLGIDVKEYEKIEKGEKYSTTTRDKNIDGDEIVLIANFLKRDFRYFVTGDYPSPESQIKEMFRQNNNLVREDRLAIQEFSRLCENEYFLEKTLGYKEKSFINYENYKFSSRIFKSHGTEMANSERRRLSLGSKPIANIFDLIREQGIHLFKRKLIDQNISGLYLLHPFAGHCILINYSDDIYRQNFSAAHEYCHSIVDSSLEQIVSYFDVGGNKYEWRANNFAGNFLVCDDYLIQQLKDISEYKIYIERILKSAHYFKVSSKVIILRLFELKLINSDFKNKLWEDSDLVIKAKVKFDPEIPRNLSPGFKEKINSLIQNGLSWYFLELCGKAYHNKQVTFHKILEMLSIPFDEGIKLLHELKIFLKVSEDG